MKIIRYYVKKYGVFYKNCQKDLNFQKKENVDLTEKLTFPGDEQRALMWKSSGCLCD